MTRFHFSLKRLFALIAAVSIACAALAKPSNVWVAISQWLLFGHLFFALFSAIYGNARVRAFWVGFATTGWTWFALQLLSRPTRLTLPTAIITDYLQERRHPAVRTGHVLLNGDVLRAFDVVAASLWPLIVSAIGGIVAYRIHTRQMSENDFA